MQIRLPLLVFSNTGIYHYSHDIESQFQAQRVSDLMKDKVGNHFISSNFWLKISLQMINV